MNINDPEVLRTAQMIQSKPNLLDDKKPTTVSTTTSSSVLNINLSSSNNNKPKPLNITTTSAISSSNSTQSSFNNNNNNNSYSTGNSYNQQQSEYSFYGPSASSSNNSYQQPYSPASPKPAAYHSVAPPAPRPAYQAPSAPRFNAPRAPAVRGGRGSALLNSGVSGSNLPTCSECKQLVRGPFVSAIGKIWCPGHFVCAHPSCGTSLQDVGFVEENGKLYCDRDYEQYFAPRCYKCKTPVLAECSYALEKAFHPECFTCGYCKQPIGSNSFHLEDGIPYCMKDYAALFSTKCAGCEFPIEAGDKFTEAMGQNYHVECFTCTTCNHPLNNGYVNKNNKPYCKKHGTSFR